MSSHLKAIDHLGLKVQPLSQRRSLSSIEQLLIDPDEAPTACDRSSSTSLDECARNIASARTRGASVILMYGAHLIKNGALKIVSALLDGGWVTQLATNGAGTIHDWELAFLGRTEESVEKNVATGTFGAWDETGRYIHLALLAGGVQGMGYGESLGRFISEESVTLPSADSLRKLLREEPSHPFTAARADLLQAILMHQLPDGRVEVKHPWKATSILGRAFDARVPLTVHPGIGYDIISNHPMFNGAAIGRAAALDFDIFAGAVAHLDGGVVLSVGSAIMAPQVFEKSLSCVNNLRLQEGRTIISCHSIYVVDIQHGGHWDWSKGEPPKSDPAYYLRFCKSFSRMGGKMTYVQCQNAVFVHQLLARLKAM
jgi:hypothetical protein